MSLLGKSWHPKHLVCTSCKAPLLEEDGSQRSIYNQDGFPFCSKEHGKQWKTGAGAIVHVQLKKKKKDRKKDKKKSKRRSGGRSAAEEAQELAQARRKREGGGSGDDNDEEEGPSRVCHVCVAELEGNHRFCPFCGASQAAATGTGGGAGGDAVAATLKTEMSRLRRQVKDLEDSLKRERSLVSALQKVKQAGGFGGGGGGGGGGGRRVRFDEEEATTQDETQNSSRSALAPPPLSAKAGGPPPAPPAPPLASDEDDDEWDEWDLDADAVEMTPQEALFVPVIEYLNEEGITADTITTLSNDGVCDLDSLRDLVEVNNLFNTFKYPIKYPY